MKMMDDQQFRQLLEFYSLSWSGYRKVRKGVKKRIRRHMQSLACSRIADYMSLLGRDDSARRQCERLMSVSISRFFRDIRLWQILEQQLLPDIIRQRDHLSIWSAGCACGEETYSFKIILEQLTTRRVRLPESEILATDYNPHYLERARSGIYTTGSFKNMPHEMLEKYFHRIKGGKRFQISSDLKSGIVWQEHHLLSKPPDSGYDIIFLRNNLLTYYSLELQIAALKPLVTCLTPGGLLIIGANEILPDQLTELEAMAVLPYVFRKKESAVKLGGC